MTEYTKWEDKMKNVNEINSISEVKPQILRLAPKSDLQH
jgi:hypothetical protein